MKIIRSPKGVQAEMLACKRKKRSVAFVPTMGSLHAGHLKLVEVAKSHGDVVVVSIFVNPTQFGQNEDFGHYPRDEKGDLAKLKKAGADVVFLPKVSDMYPAGAQTFVEVTEVSRGLCGDSRPGHFRGVATIVAKLFNIVQPDAAIFGKKDFQQLAVLRTMVRDLNFPIRIVGVETVREKDGLAMSSRNAYLSPEERGRALGINRGLKAARLAVGAKGTKIAAIKAAFLAELRPSASVIVDYVAVVDKDTLQAITEVRKGKAVLAVAVFVGKTRLIDNIAL